MAFHLEQGRQFMEESGLDGLLLVSRENTPHGWLFTAAVATR